MSLDYVSLVVGEFNLFDSVPVNYLPIIFSEPNWQCLVENSHSGIPEMSRIQEYPNLFFFRTSLFQKVSLWHFQLLSDCLEIHWAIGYGYLRKAWNRVFS